MTKEKIKKLRLIIQGVVGFFIASDMQFNENYVIRISKMRQEVPELRTT